MAAPSAPFGDIISTTSGSSTESMRFRQSCDRCQNNKVRCNRDKPTCRRCAQKQLNCVYSPFRRIGRPKKAIYKKAVDTVGEEEDVEYHNGEDNSSESIVRTASTLSPSSLMEHASSMVATSLDDSRACQLDSSIRDIVMKETEQPLLGKHFQVSASPQDFILPTNHSDELSRSAVDTWISDHQFSSTIHSPSYRKSAATDTNTLFTGADHSNALRSDYAVKEETDCYAAVLMRTVKLEQVLPRTTSPPPIDLLLEAERDFCVLCHRLLTCAGHEPPLPTGPPKVQSQCPPHTSGRCLTSDRPVLLGLALLAERVIGMFEDMFRLAARSNLTMDRASDSLWSATLGVSGSSARRLQRSLRNTLAKPCVTLEMEAHRDLLIGNFVVQGQAKSDAMRHILKLRVQRMLSGLEAIESARRTIQTAESRRGHSSGSPLDWGGSSTVFGSVTDTLLVDLRRRIESVQGAIVLL
ncbi:hypothetical protein HD806DRAFT_523853 [Xylariaceae sp. AK1471]|nr:hypothetical protein HD806DRAFT_523853 [Xylariaceae sp. AK1471]